MRSFVEAQIKNLHTQTQNQQQEQQRQLQLLTDQLKSERLDRKLAQDELANFKQTNSNPGLKASSQHKQRSQEGRLSEQAVRNYDEAQVKDLQFQSQNQQRDQQKQIQSLIDQFKSERLDRQPVQDKCVNLDYPDLRAIIDNNSSTVNNHQTKVHPHNPDTTHDLKNESVDRFKLCDDLFKNSPMTPAYAINAPMASIKSYLEEIDELTEDIQKIIKEGSDILQMKQDALTKEFRKTMGQEFAKLKENSRRTKNQLRIEARRKLPEEQAERLLQSNTITEHQNALKHAADVISQFDSTIRARGLNLIPSGTGKEAKIEYPTFNGQSLPLVGDFLDEVESLLIQSGVPVSGRGAILNQLVKGQAKTILQDAPQERNPTFEDLATILKAHYAQPGVQLDLILRMHKSHGAVPATNDLGQSITSIYNVVKHHIKLLRAVENLHREYQEGKINENPITGLTKERGSSIS